MDGIAMGRDDTVGGSESTRADRLLRLDGAVRSNRSETDRGQLLLGSAILLAVLLVALTVILSTAIYTESLATDGTTTVEERAAMEYHTEADRHVGKSIETVNDANHTSYADLEDDLGAHVDGWTDLSSRHHAVEGAATAVSITSVTEGTRVRQDDANRDFSNRTGAPSWYVAENVTAVREFGMTVDRADLHDSSQETCDDSDECFTVVVSNETESWNAAVSQDGNSVVVTIENASGAETTCSESGSTVDIDFSAGAIGESTCSTLQFDDDLDGPFTVEYDTATAVSGTYQLTVDRPLSATPSIESTPAYEPVVYDAVIESSYRSPTVTSVVDQRVTPGDDRE